MGKQFVFFLQNEGKIYLNSNRCWVTKRHSIGVFSSKTKGHQGIKEKMYTFLYRHLRSEEVGEMLHIFQGDVYLSWRLEEKHCTYIWGKGEAEWGSS